MRFARFLPAFGRSLQYSLPPVCELGVSGLLLAVAVLNGCGGSPSPSTPPLSGNTTVAIQLSSKANDQLVQYTTQITSISLTNQAGKTTTIFNTPTNIDFIPANGNAYPLATVQVPQDIYTSASINMTTPWFSYTYMGSGGSITTTHFTYSTTPTPAIVVPQPVTVSGSSMGLILSLDVSKSLASSNYSSPSSFTGNPTLDLSVFPLTAEATTPLNGKCLGLVGQITAMNLASNSMTVTLAGDGAIGAPPSPTPANGAYAMGAAFTVALNSATQYQGVAAAGGLATGEFVNLDLALQPDGTYAATRVEVQDATTANVTSALVLFTSPQYVDLTTMPFQYQGSQLQSTDLEDNMQFVYSGTSKFQVSARLGSTAGLSFTPAFTSNSLIPGQAVSIGTLSYPSGGGTYSLPTSITLLPQTIDATVTGITTSGSYTVYTVQLAPYDPILSLNGPPVNPNNNPVPNPGIVNIYVNSNTSMLNTTTPAIGGVFRFNGLLFDDGGVLRMVALQVNDGVTL